MAGDVGDLALLDAGGCGGGGVAGAQRVTGERGGGGALFDDQRDGLVGEPLVGERVASAHPAEHRAAVDAGSLEPRAELLHGAYGVSCARVRDGDECSGLLLVGLRLANPEGEAAVDVEAEVLNVEGDELGAARCGGEAEQQQRPIAEVLQGVGRDRLEQLLEGAEGERVDLLAGGAERVADAGEDLRDRGGVARVGVILRAVGGGDRGGATGDRDRSELAVGLGGQERGDGRRRRRQRPLAVLGAPARECAPVVLIRASRGGCERGGGVALGAL